MITSQILSRDFKSVVMPEFPQVVPGISVRRRSTHDHEPIDGAGVEVTALVAAF